MSLSDSISRFAQRAQQGRLAISSPVLFRGETIRVVLGTPAPRLDLEPGGFRSQADFSCRFLQAPAPALKRGEVMTLLTNGKLYKVLEIFPQTGASFETTEIQCSLIAAS